MKKILFEIGREFLNIIFGNVYNKIGLSLLLSIVSIVLILVPTSNEIHKSKWFIIVGGILILLSLFLIYTRYLELNKKNIDKTKKGK